jgi:hypothetical protein
MSRFVSSLLRIPLILGDLRRGQIHDFANLVSAQSGVEMPNDLAPSRIRWSYRRILVMA